MKKTCSALTIIIVLTMLFWTSVRAESSVYVITSHQWAMPRKDTSLIRFPPLSEAVEKFRQVPGSRLVIRYPGGDEGTLWINELQSWLVALGIASSDMELVPGSSRQAVIELEVISN